MTRDRVAALRRLSAVRSGIFSLLNEAKADLEGPLVDLDHELVGYSLGDVQELVHLLAELTHAKPRRPRRKK